MPRVQEHYKMGQSKKNNAAIPRVRFEGFEVSLQVGEVDKIKVVLIGICSIAFAAISAIFNEIIFLDELLSFFVLVSLDGFVDRLAEDVTASGGSTVCIEAVHDIDVWYRSS